MTTSHTNPPAPGRPLQQHEVTPQMSSWAVQLLHSNLPMFTTRTATFGSMSVIGRIEWHPPDPPVGPNVWHRGVTLYEAPAVAKTIEGVDVSHWQTKAGPIDWARVKAAGISFAMLKATQGVRYVWAECVAQIEAAQAAGVKCGAYCFFEPGVSGRDQAGYFLSAVDLDLDLRPALDVEQRGVVNVIEYVDEIHDWLDVVSKDTGKRPRVYTSPNFWQRLGSPQVDADLWLAAWRFPHPPAVPPFSSVEIWQTSNVGTVDGITGYVDLDRFMLDDLNAG